MPTTTESRAATDARIEGAGLTEVEIRDLLEILLRQAAEDSVGQFFEDHCRGPLDRIGARLRKAEEHALRLMNHGR